MIGGLKVRQLQIAGMILLFSCISASAISDLSNLTDSSVLKNETSYLYNSSNGRLSQLHPFMNLSHYQSISPDHEFVLGNNSSTNSSIEASPIGPTSIEWQKSLGGSSSDLGRCIWPTTDGGYIVAGQNTSNDCQVSGNHGGTDLWVVKVINAGNLQWQKCLGGNDND
jgi:hypothetical protein